MFTEDKDFVRVVEFIAEKGWIEKRADGWTTVGWFRRRPIDGNTRIEWDLGCTGDDMEDFMKPFLDEFGISPQGFVPARYFHGEGMSIPFCTPVLYFLFNRKPYPPGPTYDLTIGDLVRCVQAGMWVDPPNAPEWIAPVNTFREFLRSLPRNE